MSIKLVALLVFPAICIMSMSGSVLLTRKKGKGSSAVATTSIGADSPTGSSGAANISTYGGPGDDNDIGFTGVDLNKFGDAGLTFRGKPLLPIAVFMGHGATYLYKILEVTPIGLKPFYGAVVDVCNSSVSTCRVNTAKGGRNFLIDIHRSGWPKIPLSNGESYFSTGRYKVVGSLKPSDIPKSIWMPKVAANTDYMACSCTGSCTGNDVVWKPLNQC